MPQRPLRRALVLGLGNPLAGDDGFGRAVLEILRAQGPPPGVELRDAHTDLLGHLDQLAEVCQAVLIDAVLAPGAAGQVMIYDEQQLGSFSTRASSGHQLSPAFGIKLFRTLHPDAPTRIDLVALGTEQIRLGIGLSEPACASAGAEAVRRLLRQWWPPAAPSAARAKEHRSLAGSVGSAMRGPAASPARCETAGTAVELARGLLPEPRYCHEGASHTHRSDS